MTRAEEQRRSSEDGNTAKPYLSADELAELTPWTRDAIEKLVRRGVLVRGVHFFQPFGRRGRLIFKWAAIVSLIEGRPVQSEAQGVVEGADVGASGTAGTVRSALDVEKATTGLQRLLS